jgi:hypothetical protein
MIDQAPARLTLRVTSDPTDPLDADALAKAAASLNRELADTDLVAGSEPLAAGTAGPGAKSGEAIAIGALLVAVLPATVPALIGFLKDWLLRNRGLKIKLQMDGKSLELEGYDPATMSRAELDDLISALKRQLAGD